MSSFTNNPKFDNILLQTLMGRLQVRPPPNGPLLTQSLEDLLYDAAANLSDDDEDDDSNINETRTQLAKEEVKLEKEIIKVIHTGKTESLKPNTGLSVTVCEHHICVGFHEETGSEYRVWEWHGHIMLFDEVNGYQPEYIYGNYFERLPAKIRGRVELKVMEMKVMEAIEEEERAAKFLHLGLRELIENVDTNGGRIVHRNLNAGSPRF